MAERRRTEREGREAIARMAQESFAAHVIEARDTNRWRCAKPGTSTYSFNVILVPGLVVVYGDVGDAMLRTSYRDAAEIVAWLKGGHWDYLCGKLMFKEAFREFYPDDAVDWVRDYVKSCDEQGWGSEKSKRQWKRFLTDVERYREHGDLNEYEWHGLVNEMGLDVDAHGVGTGLSSGAFWTVECLHKFVELYEQSSRVADGR